MFRRRNQTSAADALGTGSTTGDGTARFVTGTWLGATPKAGEAHQVLSAARDLGIGLIAVDSTPSAELQDAASDLGLLLRADLSIDAASAPRLGWHGGDERDFPEWIRKHRRRAAFITSVGAPSIGADHPLADDAASESITTADLDRIDPSGCLAHHNPPEPFASRAAWAESTRNYQAMVVRFAVESLRARSHDPVRGFLHAALLDHAGPIASPGLLGADLAPKEAFRAFEVANRPVMAIADRLPGHLHGDEALALDLTVVNDLDEPVVGAELVATLQWADGEHRWGKRVEVGSFGTASAGTPQFVVPAVSGPLTLTLDLELPTGVVQTFYTSEIYAHPHDH